MKLIIAEKPDQAAKLAAPFPSSRKKEYIAIKSCPLFPEGAAVTWAVGHLCELVPPEEYTQKWKKWQLETLPIVPPEFKYRVSKTKWKAFKVIKEFVHRPETSEVIIAGDAGREGEAIVRLVLQQAHNKKPLKRLWISSLTPKAVTKGFEQLKNEEDTRPLFHEAISRAYADWLVGMNASRAYTLLLQQKGAQDVFSTGRVQTPTLALIVKREEEIEIFKPEPFWEVKAVFSVEGKLYEGIWHKEGETRLDTPETADKIAHFCKGKHARVTGVHTKEKVIHPPYLFNLSALQAAANKRFKYSPKKTLDIAQKLYVKGYVSYPRTDSSFVTKEEAAMFPGLLDKFSEMAEFKPFFPLPVSSLLSSKRYVNDKKVKDHYAIIPTEQVVSPDTLPAEEKNIYRMIAERLIAAHHHPCKMNYTTIDTLVDERAAFRSKGKQVIDEGWRKVIPASKEASGEEKTLPVLAEGERGFVKEAFSKESKTQPPKRYTEGDLITLMKTAGKHIDDESLIKVMKETEGLGTEATRAGIIGVLKDRGYIHVTKNQVYATEKGKTLIQAVGESILASPEMTAKWEQRLAEIGQGKADMNRFLEQAKALSSSIIEDAKQRSSAWSFNPEILGDIISSRKGKRYKGKAESLGGCPQCNGKVIDKGNFYGCANYRKSKCPFTVSKRILSRPISGAQMKKLLKNGKTDVIKGFQNNGKTFDASLVWEGGQNKLTFSFQNNNSENR
ncbi:DNA topoisomerase III [Salipaludibacillus sp. CUR1]|uniref:DNA topoisomerase III n=1 Tax=Salipaludibacillus sp. CUR1 TaxID=2820003 RepID=UPI001E567390|nr:DNA topoisomerase III [Salipaludibacillus sp. CUR1]MCE7791927.1 DNA topoisomerase III [Salipaludibacillus sp. CUR1]